MMEANENVTPTNSPTNTLKKIPPVRQRKQSPLRLPDIKIFCDSYQLLFSQMVCPNCEAMMTSPIRLCSSGHSFCAECLPWISLCTICFAPLTDTPNKNLEDLLSLTSFCCPGRLNGCDAKMQLSSIIDHYKYCDFSEIQCPISRIKEKKCVWYGLKKHFPLHVRRHVNWQIQIPKHKIFSDYFTVTWNSKPKCAFICVKDEIFLYSRFVIEDKWFCMLQQTGMTRGKYECVFLLEGVNGLDRIRMRHAIRSTDESLMNEFSFGRYLRMSTKMIQHFIDDDYMNFTIIINDVTKRSYP
ncbi:E3 ubiquitin-protein ligase siah-1-like isoform X2 [Zootermopsis nevadensis]|uniref:E3 ubiquitin-protein ligase siah-1-like isoform X2 n=1 Tax=Zootermopsis nevadensis TaxID=136037 RepID=UPI000B8E4F05|nr:E3 ubiquitin-protein ligase siah-1-like isoform X2 [Zootermopsis nevadensis]